MNRGVTICTCDDCGATYEMLDVAARPGYWRHSKSRYCPEHRVAHRVHPVAPEDNLETPANKRDFTAVAEAALDVNEFRVIVHQACCERLRERRGRLTNREVMR